MSNLVQKIQDNLKGALKKGDQITLATLRMLSSELKNAQIEKKAELRDEDVLKVIQKQVKSRQDSVEQFRAGGRDDLVGKEEAEIKILETYLPEQLSEDEVREIVKEAISKTNATGMGDMGKVMEVVMGQVSGRAQGGVVSGIVKEELQG